MSVLILHRNPLEPFPYDRWLHDYPGDIVVLADRSRFAPGGEPVPVDDRNFSRLEVLDRFDTDVVVKRGLDLCGEFGVTHVIAHHEADVDAAAQIREHLGLDGPWTADVLPFRDKALMKQRVRRAGLDVAPYVLARDAGQAREFIAAQGLPVVLKDRAGYNAIGLHILRDEPATTRALAAAYAGGERDDLLLERFVPGRMCHVDGLVVGGRTVLAWPAQYQYDLASFGSDPGARIDLTFEPGDPLTARLLDFAERTRAALTDAGSRLTDHGFHAEIFHTPDDRLVLCEMASRPAGAKIREVFEALFAMNLGEYATRAQLGLPLPGLGAGAPPAPRTMAGQVLMMKRPGRVRSVPSPPPEPWVHRFWRYAEPGQVIPPAAGSSDFLLAAVGTAPTREGCLRRLRALGDRFTAQTVIEEPA
ncbi:hypothetical protein Ani05nite_27390 [Amorphoplanes nipponensis]|uniref:ATP-grasp domain-containing protein n=1 Tax=Actinoplanes nipponensis TaxID=135950 RepID=A0A919MTK3_9ACTN|nr:ATP-grasp domain-containing protein [Actinoplanes nipponensis]GIE49205.1 hypothetical protein Ani05nite_27390 [Actinoplanes nipponensis]